CPHPESAMSESPPTETRHWLERLMDNPWLLLFLGVLVPLLSYTLWGWIELANMPQATLP
ncbi:MAG TPA: hypothetical protein PK095_06860, partial [Myxococcota bacterium]|nr:hypothetical protein [Myxococcota bacterium]